MAEQRDGRGRFLPGHAPLLPVPHQRGAPLGNVNAVKRPWAVFWRRRALRKEDRWVLPLMSDYEEGLVGDKGGRDNMSAAELHMVTLAALARGCTMLVLAEAAKGSGIAGSRRSATVRQGERGEITRQITDADLMAALSRFMTIERHALEALGLDRRARTLDYRTYLTAPSALLPADAPPQ